MRSPALLRNLTPFPNSKRRRSWELFSLNFPHNQTVPPFVIWLIADGEPAFNSRTKSHVSRIDAVVIAASLDRHRFPCGDERICVNVIPKALKSDHGDQEAGLTTPLSMTGTPRELDETPRFTILSLRLGMASLPV